MAIRIKPRGGNTTELNTYTPQPREIVINTDTNQVHVGDGTTAGGIAVSSTSTIPSATTLPSPANLTVGTIEILTETYNDTTVTPNQTRQPGLYQVVTDGMATPTLSWQQLSSFDNIPSENSLPTTAPSIGHIIYLNGTNGTEGLYISTAVAAAMGQTSPYKRVEAGVLSGSGGNAQIARIVGGNYDVATRTLTVPDPNPDDSLSTLVVTPDDSSIFITQVNVPAHASNSRQTIAISDTLTNFSDLAVNDSVNFVVYPTADTSTSATPTLTTTATILDFESGSVASNIVTTSIVLQFPAQVVIAAGSTIRINRRITTPLSSATVNQDASDALSLSNIDPSRYPITITNGVASGVDNTPISWTQSITPWQIGRVYMTGQRVIFNDVVYTSKSTHESHTSNQPKNYVSADGSFSILNDGTWESTGGNGVFLNNLPTNTGSNGNYVISKAGNNITDVTLTKLSATPPAPALNTSSNFTNNYIISRTSATEQGFIEARGVPVATGYFNLDPYFLAPQLNHGIRNTFPGIRFKASAEAGRTSGNFGDFLTRGGNTNDGNNLITIGTGENLFTGSTFTHNGTGNFEVRVSYSLAISTGWANRHYDGSHTTSKTDGASVTSTDDNFLIDQFYSWINLGDNTRFGMDSKLGFKAQGINNVLLAPTNESSGNFTTSGAAGRNVNHNTSAEDWGRFTLNGLTFLYNNAARQVHLRGSDTILMSPAAGDDAATSFSVNVHQSTNSPLRIGGGLTFFDRTAGESDGIEQGNFPYRSNTGGRDCWLYIEVFPRT